MTLLSFKNKVTFAKCNNKKCSNFTTNHDLSGSWCMDESRSNFDDIESWIINPDDFISMEIMSKYSDPYYNCDE